MGDAQVPATKVTIRHVASDAGVSVAAVSKVLRNAYGVSDGLREKVQQSIKKLNYRPSTAARGMRGHTFSVGMLLIEMQNPFLPSIVAGAKDALQEAGYKTLIGVGEANASIERSLVDSMIDLQMDGLILVAPRLTGRQLARYAAQRPMVVIGHHEADATAFDTVNCDDVAGARMAVDSLIAQGLRDIEMISLSAAGQDHEVCALRERGYRAAMTAAGLESRIRIRYVRDHPYNTGTDIAEILTEDRLPEAFFCWSDIHAIALLNHAYQLGLDVPGRLSVVGYDNTPTAGLPLVGLSSIEQHGADLGRIAATSLLSRLGGRTQAEHRLVTPDLLERRSSLRRSTRYAGDGPAQSF